MNIYDPETLSKVFQDSFSTDIKNLYPIENKGITNRVYLVETVNNKKYVARLNQIDHLDEFTKELDVSEKAIDRGVATPQIIKVAQHQDTAYSIQGYIEGAHGSYYEDKLKVWHDIGENARLIHSVITNGFGERVDENGNFLGSWDDYLDYNIRSLDNDDFLLKEGVISKEESLKMRELFENFKQRRFDFGLVHGDLSLKNTIVDGQNKVWIIDWGSAHSHIIPHYDFIEILESSTDSKSEEFERFLKGYGYTTHDFSLIEKEIYLLMLLRAIDKTRWAKDKKPELLDSKIKTLEKVLSKYKDMLFI